MAQLISSLHATGTAVLMSTHDNDEAQTPCPRVGLMQGGRLAAVGTPAELCALVPGRAVATVMTPDPAAVRARAARRHAARCGAGVRRRGRQLGQRAAGGAGACLPGSDAGAKPREAVLLAVS